MSITADYNKELMSLSKKMPENKLKKLLAFAYFLKSKKTGFSYDQVEDSVEYVKKLRVKEGKKVRYGKNFIKELIEWQKSNS